MSEAKISAVVATDTYATIRAVVDRLRRQTVKHQIELVLVAPRLEDLQGIEKYRGKFAAVQTLEHPSDELAVARGAGIRAASTSLVFVGETHGADCRRRVPDQRLRRMDRLSGRTLAAGAPPHARVRVHKLHFIGPPRA